ncbi:hypothetical protein SAMN05720473_101308 [Fibrobacter sp. UWB15]|uniref:hypothetical protein n=1 Tax=unclassified Fibrobacter TaxID=2634177 RepID=UPI00091224C3|nr:MULTISPECIES: hypothetical protein [unclassified Fibrobacter]PWJ67437.1 hypothetical protein BGW99_101308 [Fibrobacter sp. UWB6]SHF67485.1 hypothetical protein SAMN05720760_101273 [Fibrobacter sp. UWB8]SMG10642.1 hypothetical protein SAMN05720473_101308 [Fibrobacter sp. UWB15]
MKKKKFCFLSIFATIAFALSACIFESDDDGLETWLSDRGMPSNYQVQTLTIKDLKVASAKTYLDTTPKSGNANAVLGQVSNLSHDIVMDIGFRADTNFLNKLKASDTSGVYLGLFWLRPLYNSKFFPSDSLPYDEDLDVNVSWILQTSTNKKFLDSIMGIDDSTWYADLANWEATGSVDTVYNVKMAKGDTSIRLDLPSELVKDLKAMEGSARLQLRLSAPKAKRIYRFYGAGTDYPPLFALYSDSTTYLNPAPSPFRMAGLVKSNEDCSDCPVLHGGVSGGVLDSMVVEFSPEPILDALSEFYGDEFPYEGNDENDVRQTVIFAQLTMARDDSNGSKEFNWPIQVVLGSYVDSADMAYGDEDLRYRRMERYLPDSATIVKSGHQNLVFHEGDSLTLQLTYGLRDFINKASDGRNMKFAMRLGMPFLQEKKSLYTDYRTNTEDTLYMADGTPLYMAKGDTITKYFSYFDYARYDFSTAVENPMTLKLWLASKRGDK